MRRKIDAFLDNWLKNEKALIVTGARQTGKTYAIREAFNRNGFRFVEINLDNDPNALSLFSKLTSAEDFYMKLSLISGEAETNGKAYVFLDEIQAVYIRREKIKKEDPKTYDETIDPITLSKKIVEDGRYKVVFSGSLLGVCLNGIRLNPLGYMDSLKMFPMDFEEYLWAKGVGDTAIKYIEKCYENRSLVDSTIHNRLMNLFKEYILVGGMPEVVSKFIETNNFQEIDKIQKQIIDGYKQDILKYIEDNDKKLIVSEAFESLPAELNRRDKHFKKSHLKNIPNSKNLDMENAFLWLTSAGIALPTYNVSDATFPLKLNEQRSALKLFASDIGLLSASLLGIKGRIMVLNDEKEINYGAPYENVIAQELTAHGYAPTHYYNSKKNGEIDFVLENASDIIPIEVKSGKSNISGYYDHAALNKVLSIHKEITEAFVLSSKNLSKETERITNLPLYMAMFIKKE